MLIGPNNAGKSNVLDAIIAWSANTYADKRNISDTFMPAKMRNPLVELFTLVDDKRNWDTLIFVYVSLMTTVNIISKTKK